jgi:hypothetical protein
MSALAPTKIPAGVTTKESPRHAGSPPQGAPSDSRTKFASSKDHQPEQGGKPAIAGRDNSVSGTEAERIRNRDWFPSGCWSGLSDQRITGLMSEHPRLPWELVMICASKSNRWGHARFNPGELEGLLGLSVSGKGVYKLLRRLSEAGAIAPESTPLCVVLDASLYRRDDNRTWTCKEPKHADRRKQKWANFGGFGWEHHRNEWNDLIAEGLSPEDALAKIKARNAAEASCTCPAPPVTTMCEFCGQLHMTWLADKEKAQQSGLPPPARPIVAPYREPGEPVSILDTR